VLLKKYNNNDIDYIWMNNVRDLIDRLMVIHGEENAGNKNFYNEKVGIMKMLSSNLSDFVINHPKGIPYLIRILNIIPHTFWKSEKYGGGIINWTLNNLKLPEMHIPGYNFCGPFTKLEERLERGDKGINPLDEACKQHDIAYHNFTDLDTRHVADKILQERVLSKDAAWRERLAAAAVGGITYGKRKLGMGIESDWGL
jgi:hypothetical protein